MAKKQQRDGFSLRRENATEGGGTEGALATITEIEFVDEFTYGGRQKDKPSAALRVVFKIDGFDKPWEQHYSVGPSDKYEVVSDGDSIRAVGKATGLNKKCPCYFFIDSVQDAIEEGGLDLDELLPEEDGLTSIRPLEDRRVLLHNVKHDTVGGDEKEYIVIGSFAADADDEKPAKGAKTSSGSKKASKSDSDDVEAKTIAAIEALIEEHTSVKKGNLAEQVYQANKKDPDAKAMMQLCFKEAFITDDDRPWSFDKKKGLLRAAAD